MLSSVTSELAGSNAGLIPRWFFAGLAPVSTCCYPVFGSELFNDCSPPTSVGRPVIFSKCLTSPASLAWI